MNGKTAHAGAVGLLGGADPKNRKRTGEPARSCRAGLFPVLLQEIL